MHGMNSLNRYKVSKNQNILIDFESENIQETYTVKNKCGESVHGR